MYNFIGYFKFIFLLKVFFCMFFLYVLVFVSRCVSGENVWNVFGERGEGIGGDM